MPQRLKGFFLCSLFFPWSRLDFVQLHWKRSQLWEQVQILAQFLFIYSPSYFSNSCQVKTLFNQRQVNMPLPFHCCPSSLCWGVEGDATQICSCCWRRGSRSEDLLPYSGLGTQAIVTYVVCWKKQELMSQRFQFWFGHFLASWLISYLVSGVKIYLFKYGSITNYKYKWANASLQYSAR